MKRILYINLDFIMYYNKTMTQIKAFSNLGYEVFLFYVKENEICLDSFCGKIQRHLHRRKMNSKSALSKILFMQKMLTRYCEKLHITHIYMRRLMFKSILFTHFIKKQSCDKKLYYEIPTYPFDKYQDFIYDCKQNIENWYYKNILHPYMDRTVVICQDDTLLLERMVAIENGIDMEAFPEPLTREYDRINFIGVAHLLNWHGYDRFIKSMARERKRDTFHFYIISNESTELLRLRALAIEYDVSQNITFLPAMTLQEIIAFSSQCTIGVGGLAFHRRGAVYDTSIKNKEYCAMGLPFIMASNDRSFPADFPFCYNILPDESLFDIGKIIEWFRTLERSHPDYKQKMFRFAESTLSMEQYYEKILEC